MVQLFLRKKEEVGKSVRVARIGLAIGVACLMVLPASAASKKTAEPQTGPQLELEGGGKLTYEGSFNSEHEVQNKRSFWKKVLDVVVGAPEYRSLVRPYSVARDSRGRVIVTDPGAAGVHIFDFAEKKYKFLSRWDKDKDPLRTPQCVAVDAQDNIYVTDSVAGKIFVFDAKGKYKRAIGSVKGGEGYFKRPTGIAVDSAAGRIYVTDTLRDKVFTLDMQGNVLGSFGKRGDGPGEFNLPTEVHLQGDHIAVVDALNTRIEFFDRAGGYESTFSTVGENVGLSRPKGMGFDSEGHLYVADASANVVQVFNEQGQLLYSFGVHGTGAGEFQLPSGVFIDREDRIFVADSYNRRIQIFHYFGRPRHAEMRQPEVGK